MRALSFRPGLLLWVFTLIFLPLFVVLGFWQLNRAVEKEQMKAMNDGVVRTAGQIDWLAPPLYADIEVNSVAIPDLTLLLDNKTYNGQVGYEVFQLHKTSQGTLAVSLGWVAGSPDRTQLPNLVVPDRLINQKVTIRPTPTNPLFGVDANMRHETDSQTWVVQTLTTQWLSQLSQQNVLGFVQLIDAEAFGVGPVVWQPSVMSPAKHRGYAFQWFGMAIALLGMFIYAGLRSGKQSKN